MKFWGSGILVVVFLMLSFQVRASTGVGNGFLLRVDPTYGYTVSYPEDWTVNASMLTTTVIDNSSLDSDPRKQSSLTIEVIATERLTPDIYAVRECPACQWNVSRFNGMTGLYTDFGWRNTDRGYRKDAVFVMKWREYLLVMKVSASPEHGGLNFVLQMLDSVNKNYFGEAPDSLAPGRFISLSLDQSRYDLDGEMRLRLVTTEIALNDFQMAVRLVPLPHSSSNRVWGAWPMEQAPIVVMKKVSADYYQGSLSLKNMPRGDYEIDSVSEVAIGRRGKWMVSRNHALGDRGSAGTIPASLANFEILDPENKTIPFKDWRVEVLSPLHLGEFKPGESFNLDFATNFSRNELLTASDTPALVTPIGHEKSSELSVHRSLSWVDDHHVRVKFTILEDALSGNGQLYNAENYLDVHQFRGVLGGNYVRAQNRYFTVTGGKVLGPLPPALKIETIEPLSSRVRCGEDTRFRLRFTNTLQVPDNYEISSDVADMHIVSGTTHTLDVSYPAECIEGSPVARIPYFKIVESATGRKLDVGAPRDGGMHYDVKPTCAHYSDDETKFTIYKVKIEPFAIVSPLEW